MKRKVIALATLGLVVIGLTGLTAAPASAQGCYNNNFQSGRFNRQARRAYQRQLRLQSQLSNQYYNNSGYYNNGYYNNGCSPYNNGVVGRVLNWIF
ncbi:MAG: hypothetical protein K2Z81_23880 [Cyanobacteria bacterium]|nr:hypothetical protein [Cyanobacteriota bacterium]